MVICEKIGLTDYIEREHLNSSHRLLTTLKQIEPFKDWNSMKNPILFTLLIEIF